MCKLNPSIKYQVLVGVFISVWIYVFTFYIKPFDGENGNASWWGFLSLGFSLLTFICYLFVIIIQDSVYQKIYKWNVVLEIITIALFYLLLIATSFLYYKSPFLNGIWNFSEFVNAVFKTLLIFTPILVFSRRFIIRFLPKEKITSKTEDVFITIKGDYKLDVLKIKKSDLVCISKSQNYIEIFYLENKNLKSKLMRSSLKRIQQNLKFLVQVHRSHLVNPVHFKSWENSNTIVLTQINIPVSKNYKVNTLSF